MNINFGLFEGKETKIKDKKARNQSIVQRGLEAQSIWLKSVQEA